MGPVTAVLGWAMRARMTRFRRAATEPDACQGRVLDGLLERASGTEWGRRFALGEVRGPEQFRRRVPLTDYPSSAPHWHRAFDGARDVTWPGHVRYFALSSGTTGLARGEAPPPGPGPTPGDKLLPVTADAIASNRRSGVLLAAFLAHRGSAASLAGGKFLYLGGCTALRRKGPCLFGDASGIMARHVPWCFRHRRLPSRQVAAIADWRQKVERIVADSLTDDVRVMGACPSWAALLFRRMLQEASARGLGGGPVGRLWPNLTHFVSYGMALGPYRPAFEQYIGRPVEYVDTYSSSEGGMTAIQGEPGGPLELIVDNGVFFEFIPADQADRSDPPRLHLGEVEPGRDYAVALSTNGGIWAYPLGDVVRFESVRPPRIVFVGRTGVMLSAFGEHVTGEMIENAVADACRATGAIVADYTIQPLFPSAGAQARGGARESPHAAAVGELSRGAAGGVAPSWPPGGAPLETARPAHRWIVEFDRPPALDEQFMAAVDASIRRVNEDYDTHRTDDFGMSPPVLTAVAPGTFAEWMRQKGKLGGQHKVPRVVGAPRMAEELLAISARGGRAV